MRALPLFLASALAAAGSARAEVDVQLKGGKVDLRATAAPLTEVLDRLSRATGMKVVQQGATPSMLLSLHLQDRTPAEAVFGVLEGLGLNYALVLDAAGQKIDTLVLAGAAGAKMATTSVPAASAAPAPPPRYVPRPEAPPPGSGPDASDDEGEEEMPVDEGEDASDEGDEAAEAAAAAAEAGGKGPGGPRGSVLQTPAQSVFPTSPFAPRAPMFVPQAEPTPQPAPTPPPRQP
jgi:hypothetical protein